MNAYALSLIFWLAALLMQVRSGGIAVEQWLRREHPQPRRRLWLTLALAGLLAALHHGYALELAARTSLYDLRQATLAMLASLLSLYAVHLIRKS